MLQQFFMVPSFRYGLLEISDGKSLNEKNNFNIDDNILHQVQKMFSYLDLSQREDYNPFDFCYSYKDFEGKPTNLTVQQDSQEFLANFLDKMEFGTKQTENKYLLQSIFRGKTSSQLLCEQGCGSVKNKFEDFYNLSVEVNNMKTIYDSLDKFMSPEKIDEYNCETCNKKVTITKRNSLAELPNILIIHLQRISYNYVTDRTEKINSKLEFPKLLNLKNFTMEELARKAAASKEGGSASEDELKEVIENDEVYFRHNNYYEYFLTGVVVHLGSAEAGHYFSYINTNREGVDHEPSAIPNSTTFDNNWLKFNDSYISKFDISRLEEETFGGVSQQESGEISWKPENIQSAYMLVYERRLKSPLKIIIKPDSIAKINNDNLISFKEEEYASIKKKLDLARSYGTPEFIQQSNSFIFNNTFYDAKDNEYFIFKPYYSKERIIPKKYYLSILEDNTLFEKQQIITDHQLITLSKNITNW